MWLSRGRRGEWHLLCLGGGTCNALGGVRLLNLASLTTFARNVLADLRDMIMRIVGGRLSASNGVEQDISAKG
jgi:hypothetical protein